MSHPSHHHHYHFGSHTQGAERLVKLASTFSLLAAGTLIAIKLLAWLMTDSLSMLSTLADSLLDIMASLVNFVAVRYALKPPDKEHRFGHGKAEYIAGLAQSAFIAGSGLFICAEAVQRFITPHALQNEPIGIAVTIISIVVTFALVGYQRHVIKKTGSTVIRSDSLHYVTDLLTNLGVLVAMATAYYLDWLYADPVIALLIAGYILYNAWEIGHFSFNHLVDHEFEDADREKIKEIVRAHPQVRGLHDLKTRRSGLYSFIQLHVEFDGALTLNEAHMITESIELALEEIFPNTDILIHQDPVGTRCG